MVFLALHGMAAILCRGAKSNTQTAQSTIETPDSKIMRRLKVLTTKKIYETNSTSEILKRNIYLKQMGADSWKTEIK